MPIQKLKDHVINQIAAGEVVERPASVIKELIENSIDAGATLIEVQVIDGGKQSIRVTDNGGGINIDDFPLVFERHATSKITNMTDLENVLTMGFRGEALASIGSVAEVTVASRTHTQDQGWRITKIGPAMTDPEPIAMACGTSITVTGLFKDVPAREKYLKGDNTEYRYIAEIMLQHAAAQPNIHFKLTDDNKTKIDLPIGDLQSRAMQILSVKDTDLIIPITYISQDLKIYGYMGKPQLAQKSKTKQFIAVNKRPLQVPFVSRAVKDALHTLIPHNENPIFLVDIEIEPTAVDVNVHPRKLEARFVYQQFVYQKLRAAVKASAEKHILTAKIQFGSNPILPPTSYAEPNRQSFNINNSYKHTESPTGGLNNYKNPATTIDAMAYNQSFSYQNDLPRINQHQGLAPSLGREKNVSLEPIAQIDKSYIIAVGQEGIVVIDQHAAHERVRYGKLQQIRQQYRSRTETCGQKLLVPVKLDLNESEKAVLDEFLPAIASVGFEIENYELNAVPAALVKDDLSQVLRGLITDLQESIDAGVVFGDMEERIERVINYTACRSAIKFGQELSLEEMRGLIQELDDVEQNYSCPHGRPTRICLNFKDLEKEFGR